jgi:hypothetical protein
LAWEPPFYQLEKSLLRIWRGVSGKFEKSGQVARGWVNSRVLHKSLSLDVAINNVAGVGGPRAADVLAGWAVDPRFTIEQRIKAAHVLTTVDIDRATEVTQDLMADRSLTHQERDLATKALIPDPPPRSQMEALYLHNAHTPSDLRRVRAILG